MATPASTTRQPVLRDQDLVDPLSFIRQVCDERYAFSQHLCRRLDAPLLDRLRSASRRGVVESDLKRPLLEALNALLPLESLFDEAVLQVMALTDETQSLLRDRPAGETWDTLNRRLLAEAYPWSIAVNLEPRTPVWHKYQVAKFGKLHARYAQYADRLRHILEEACASLAPLAIVQARAKTVSSFAEKVWRKQKYVDPLTQITDLCGARVITETPEEVEQVCRYLRRFFTVDEANSVDALTRLRTEEFGYLSMHYIVQLGDELLQQEAEPELLQGLKAEIQVRTLLQHAWASISHDRIYKSQFNVPEHWKRELARVAALLEHADSSFAGVINGLDTYKGYYGAYMTDDEMKQEVETLQTILANEPNAAKKPGIALQIARLAKARWDWQRVVTLLDDYVTTPSGDRATMLAEHGNARCHLHLNATGGDEYQQGIRELEQARRIAEDDANQLVVDGKERTAIYAALAWAYGNVPGCELKARGYYRQAYEGNPDSPYHLVSYLEYEIRCIGNRDFVGHMHHTLQLALQQCRAHIKAGIELPWAFFTMGKLYLLLGQHYEALTAYAKAMSRCWGPCYPPQILEDQRKFIANINFAREYSEGDRWVDDLLVLAQALIYQDQRSLTELESRRVRTAEFNRPVVIVAGGTDGSIEPSMAGYRECLFTAFTGFEGTIISGGTTSGIPGIIGEIGEQALREGKTDMHLLAYTPRALPVGAKLSAGYAEHLPTDGADFSARQPLQNWIDLVAAGVKPSSVRMLGINGGKLALLEYHLALALGASVGLVSYSGRAVTELRADADWLALQNLLWIPFDRMAVRAFVNPGQTQLTDDQSEEAGKAVHEKFLEENRHRLVDSSMLPWHDLQPGLRTSNIEQAQYSTAALRSCGYTVRERQDGTPPVNFTDDEIEAMAEMEHGRWVIERLRAGWQYGPVRDSEKKISPYLVQWSELPEDTREWNRRAVKGWPAVLAKAGLEVVKTPGT